MDLLDERHDFATDSLYRRIEELCGDVVTQDENIMYCLWYWACFYMRELDYPLRIYDVIRLDKLRDGDRSEIIDALNYLVTVTTVNSKDACKNPCLWSEYQTKLPLLKTMYASLDKKIMLPKGVMLKRVLAKADVRSRNVHLFLDHDTYRPKMARK